MFAFRQDLRSSLAWISLAWLSKFARTPRCSNSTLSITSGKFNDHFSEVIRVFLDEDAIDLQSSVVIEGISLC